LKLKLEALGGVSLNQVNEELVAKQEKLVTQLRQAKMNKEARRAIDGDLAHVH
jgi:hypothetical protein